MFFSLLVQGSLFWQSYSGAVHPCLCGRTLSLKSCPDSGTFSCFPTRSLRSKFWLKLCCIHFICKSNWNNHPLSVQLPQDVQDGVQFCAELVQLPILQLCKSLPLLNFLVLLSFYYLACLLYYLKIWKFHTIILIHSGNVGHLTVLKSRTILSRYTQGFLWETQTNQKA